MTDSSPDALDTYREQMRAWLAENLPLLTDGAGIRAAHELDPARLEADRALQKRVYDAGYIGITWPEEYGGRGLTRAHRQVWDEESAAYAVPEPGGVATGVTLGMIAPTLLAHGSEEQKRDWIPKMLSGEEIWVQLLSEPGAGSDLAAVLTRATGDGDRWVINGTKVWSSGAMVADYGVCLARTDWDAPKHRGLTWFKVPLRHADVTVRSVREINGSAEFCEEFLDDVVVGDDMRIGEVNEGWPIANTMLAFERGAGREDTPRQRKPEPKPEQRRLAPDLVELARARGLHRDAHVRQVIAKAHINDYMHGLLTQRVAALMRSGAVNPSAASYLKLGTGIIQPLRAIAAMEIAGRQGVAWKAEGSPGHVAATNYLNGRIMSIAGGSNQIQRNIISERLLGLPREPSYDTDKPFREVLKDAKDWADTAKGRSR